ncbi:hypothetical protein CDL15_Pgr013768 [Punica granatum]|uniref:Uncharacterized protein n=1 Tax=Punica granatum TaxID=22663 RepID=A0A218W2T9_PUNGR|nr:hypothetical protein CDL15_Pgr013768 [Punica granatum]
MGYKGNVEKVLCRVHGKGLKDGLFEVYKDSSVIQLIGQLLEHKHCQLYVKHKTNPNPNPNPKAFQQHKATKAATEEGDKATEGGALGRKGVDDVVDRAAEESEDNNSGSESDFAFGDVPGDVSEKDDPELQDIISQVQIAKAKRAEKLKSLSLQKDAVCGSADPIPTVQDSSRPGSVGELIVAREADESRQTVTANQLQAQAQRRSKQKKADKWLSWEIGNGNRKVKTGKWKLQNVPSGKTNPPCKQTSDDSSVSSKAKFISRDEEVSVVLHLFTDGYSIGKPSEAIECGRIPGDLLDGLPCKYVDGSIICEVKDYRKATSQQGPNAPTIDSSPIATKVRLNISLENVVRDIPLISDSSWTYGDLMDVESRILKALQPQLCLDPTPKLDKLCNEPIPPELKSALSSARKKRSRQLPEIAVTSSNRIHGKKVCIDRVPEGSDCRLGDSGMVAPNVMQQNVPENLAVQSIGLSNTLNASPRGLMSDASFPGLPLVAHQQRYQMMVGNSRGMMDRGASPAAQEMMISYSDNNNNSPSLHGRRENQEGPMSPLSSSNTHKRARPASGVPDAIQQQQLGQQMDNLHGSDMNWKNSLLQQQVLARGIQYPNAALQKYPPQQYSEGMLKTEPGIGSLPSGLQGIRYGSMDQQLDAQKLVGSEPVQINKNDISGMEIDKERLDLQQQNQQLQQRLHQNPMMRAGFSQAQWSNMNQPFESNLKKEEQLQKRKSVQSPRVSAGALAQSPISSKSGEFSSGSLGPAYGAVNQMTGIPHKDKSLVTSVSAVGAAGSITLSANDSAQRQSIPQAGGKRRSNSLPKTPAISGVGSPASVSNISIPLNANSPSMSTPPMADQSVLERFSKIEMVTMRYQLNQKKGKGDDYPIRNPGPFPTDGLMLGLSNISSNEDFKDDSCTRPLSKLLLGGSMNTCKTRLLNCVLGDRVVQGTVVSFIPKARSRMILSEKPSNGTVAIAYGEMEEGDLLEAEEHLPTLPNTHLADLLAAQFKSLMVKEGYHVEDHTLSKPIHMNHHPASSQLGNTGIPQSNSTGQIPQFAEGVPGQPPNELLSPANGGNASLNPSQNILANSRMLPPGNPQAHQMSQGLMPGVSMAARPQQMDPQQKPQQPQQQQQPPQQNQNPMIQQHPQFPRSPMMLPSNPLSHLNAIGQNSNVQMGFGNPMGIGGPRGIGGPGISASMGPMSNLGNVGQNPMNLGQASSIGNAISQRLQSGTLTTAQAAMVAKRMMQSRANVLGGPQSGMSGLPGARQMPLGSADACPASPQVSSQSQTLGSVGSINNSPMDVQNKSNSMGNR